MKKVILLGVLAAAVALGACRREEAEPMKLGAAVPAASQVAK